MSATFWELLGVLVWGESAGLVVELRPTFKGDASELAHSVRAHVEAECGAEVRKGFHARAWLVSGSEASTDVGPGSYRSHFALSLEHISPPRSKD